ncbi:MAG: hypothetical protein ACAI44_14700 [Candidatus Sericytochromatia bacterium]
MPSPTPLGNRALLFTDMKVDWQTLGEPEKARFKVQDFDIRRLVYVENSNDPAGSGEFEFRWDQPPFSITADKPVSLKVMTRNLKIPGNHNVNSRIEVSYQGSGFFKASPAEIVAQGVGWAGNTLLEDDSMIELQPIGLKDPNWAEGAKVAITFFIAHGPIISYNYVINRY